MQKRIDLGLAAAVLAVTIALPLAGCGGNDEADPAEDEAAITAVLVENEIGGPDRCSVIYTNDYLNENWNENVTAYGGDTPTEKCESQTPLEGITEADIKVTVESINGDTAVATSKVRASPGVTFALVRDGGDWRIDAFSE